MSWGRTLTTPTGALRAWWAVIAGILSLMIAVGLSIGYTAYERKVDDQRWCRVMGDFDHALPAAPPPTAQQRAGAADLHKLRLALGCR